MPLTNYPTPKPNSGSTTLAYNNPVRDANTGKVIAPSSIDGKTNPQLVEHYFYKQAIIDVKQHAFFSQMSSKIAQPKHMGKTIKRLQYIPILDDRNINDQGIDASGATITGSGNLYGSSRDIGYITEKMPLLTEHGGRVNRVGFTRQIREGSIFKLGFFWDLTQDALDFDSDTELKSHCIYESLRAANEINERLIQNDLLNAAGTHVFTGAAQDLSTMTPEGATPSVVTYDDLIRLDRILTENNCPNSTNIVKGSRNIDTRTIPSARYMFVAPEVSAMLRNLSDNFNRPAFIPVNQYADASGNNIAYGEIGAIGSFRIIEVQKMSFWKGVGATVTDPSNGYSYDDIKNKYNVFPMLVVGDDAFNTLGFETNGKNTMFKVNFKMPGELTSSFDDPYGERGFYSIKFWYGMLINRPERIGIIYTCAKV